MLVRIFKVSVENAENIGDFDNVQIISDGIKTEDGTEYVGKEFVIVPLDETACLKLAGPSRNHATLDIERVKELRKARWIDNVSYNNLAKTYDMSPAGVRNVCLRNTWKHIAPLKCEKEQAILADKLDVVPLNK